MKTPPFKCPVCGANIQVKMALAEDSVYPVAVPSKEYEDLIRELSAWCSAEHGRQQQIADEFKVSKQLVNHWLTKRRMPSLENFFALKEFLKQQKQQKRRWRTSTN